MKRHCTKSQMIKYIISDCDGTILDQHKNIDKLLLEVIKELERKGIGFSLASGRNRDLMIPLINHFSIDIPFISDNGANIYVEREKSVFSSSLGVINTNKIIKFCLLNDIPFIAYSNDKLYENLFSNHLYQYRKELIKKRKIIQANQVEIEDFIECYKITIDLNHFLESNRIIQEINNLDDNIKVRRSEDKLYTIVKRSESKGNGIKRFAEIMKCDTSEIMVFGDNYNDLSMFKTVNISVAMENSSEEVKEKAKFVTNESNNNSGVSKFLIDYFKLNIR